METERTRKGAKGGVRGMLQPGQPRGPDGDTDHRSSAPRQISQTRTDNIGIGGVEPGKHTYPFIRFLVRRRTVSRGGAENWWRQPHAAISPNSDSCFHILCLYSTAIFRMRKSSRFPDVPPLLSSDCTRNTLSADTRMSRLMIITIVSHVP